MKLHDLTRLSACHDGQRHFGPTTTPTRAHLPPIVEEQRKIGDHLIACPIIEANVSEHDRGHAFVLEIFVDVPSLARRVGEDVGREKDIGKRDLKDIGRSGWRSRTRVPRASTLVSWIRRRRGVQTAILTAPARIARHAFGAMAGAPGRGHAPHRRRACEPRQLDLLRRGHLHRRGRCGRLRWRERTGAPPPSFLAGGRRPGSRPRPRNLGDGRDPALGHAAHAMCAAAR